MRPTRRSTKRKNGGATAYSGPRHCPMNNGECERRLVLLGPARHKITNTDAIARNSALTLADEQATLTAPAARGTPRERFGASSRHGHSMTQAREIRASRITHTHWLLLGMLLVASGLLLSIRSGDAVATRGPLPADEHFPSWNAPLPLAIPAADEHGARLPATEPSVCEKAAEQWRSIIVKSGDTLSSIFARVGLNPQLLYTILSLGDEAENLKRIHPGEIIKLKLAEQSQLVELMYDIDPTRSLRIWGILSCYQSSLIERPVERRVSQAAVVITSSLFEARQHAGMSDA